MSRARIARLPRPPEAIGDWCGVCGCDQVDDLLPDHDMCESCWAKHVAPASVRRARARSELMEAFESGHDVDLR